MSCIVTWTCCSKFSGLTDIVSSESSSATTYRFEDGTYCFTTPRSPLYSDLFTRPFSETMVPCGIWSYCFADMDGMLAPLAIRPLIPGGGPPPIADPNSDARGSSLPNPPPPLELNLIPGPPIPPNIPPNGSAPPNAEEKNACASSWDMWWAPPPPPGKPPPPNPENPPCAPPGGTSAPCSAALTPSSPYWSYIRLFLGSDSVAYASLTFWKFLVASSLSGFLSGCHFTANFR
mmetsp:Transcript_21528/g.49352  ORF Transcript_21528/g.49352 Transcript_21528/m.49352 type:complete len:233 (-) Transcript_21528:148-846(-)